jgi:small multidrug resistance pump
VIAWVYMVAAIALEVSATLSLRRALSGGRRCYFVVVTGYAAAFTLISLALAAGMPLAIAYGAWTAIGVAATAVLSRVLFDEPFTPLMSLGIVLVIGGVLLLEFGR